MVLAVILYAGMVNTTPGQSGKTTEAAVLEIRHAGDNSLRISLLPASMGGVLPETPLLAEGRQYSEPLLRVDIAGKPVSATSAMLRVDVNPSPMTVSVYERSGRLIQKLSFNEDGSVSFILDGEPVLGMGEGGPRMTGNWREQEIEFNRVGSERDGAT